MGQLSGFSSSHSESPSGTESVEQIAGIDHNPQNFRGHDVRSEGIRVDVVLTSGREVTLYPERPGGNAAGNLGSVIDLASE